MEFIIKRTTKKEYEQFTTRIETDLLEKIKNIVKENNLKSVNQFINEALKYAIDNMKIDE